MGIGMSDAAAAMVINGFLKDYSEAREGIGEEMILEYETVREALEIAVERLLQKRPARGQQAARE